MLKPPCEFRNMDIFGQMRHKVVFHVGILATDGAAENNLEHDVFHCTPPVCSDKKVVDVVGRLCDITEAERNKLRLATRQVAVEMPRPMRRGLNHYSILPAIRPVKDQLSGVTVHYRFSCVGYVMYVYSKIGIELLRESSDLPLIDLQTISNQYGSLIEREKIRSECGLDGEGPWPILLSEYLIRSFDRSDGEIRSAHYIPK